MPQIHYTSSGFPAALGPNLLGDHDLPLTWSQLIWSAISVGRAELYHIVRHGRYSIFEMAYRIAILFANLMEDNQEGRLHRSSAYDGLDPSEKSAISYFLGLTVTKAFAESRLQVPWLMHLDVYRQDLNIVLQDTSRPDLVGETINGGWVVMEAKGRTNGFDSNALQRAKEQAEQVVSIDGTSPLINVGLVAHFAGGTLNLRVEDPKSERDKKSLRIPLNHAKLLDGYYRPMKSWISEAPETVDVEFQGVTYRQIHLSDFDVSVGMATSLLDIDDFSNVRSIRDSGALEESRYFATDGLFVDVGPTWSEGNMRLEPQERRV